MSPLDPQSLARAVSTFADGELDPAATRQSLQQLLDDPAAAEQLRRHQQLTVAARRAVVRRTPPVPDALLARLHEMNPPRPLRQPAWLLWIGRVAAAIVVLLVGVIAGVAGHEWIAPPKPINTTADVLPAAVVAQAEEVHGVCSRLALGLHSAGYPADVAALAAAVEHDLHSADPYPDLRPIGFAYRGAGPCGKPLADTAHLLYRSTRPGSVAAVSVFVQPWHDQYAIAPGRLYTVSVAQTPFPMLAWRTDRVVYFLLADNQATENKAVTLIRAGPTTTQP